MKTVLKPALFVLAALFVTNSAFADDRACHAEQKHARERLNVYTDGKTTFIDALPGLIIPGATANASQYIIHGVPLRIEARMNGMDMTIIRGLPSPAPGCAASLQNGACSKDQISARDAAPEQKSPVSAAELRKRTDRLIEDIARLIKAAEQAKSEAAPVATEATPHGSVHITSVIPVTIPTAPSGADEAPDPFCNDGPITTGDTSDPFAPESTGSEKSLTEPELREETADEGPPQPEPVQDTGPGHLWPVRAGQKMTDVFALWCKRAGVLLVMDETDMTFKADLELSGTFAEAVDQAIAAVRESGPNVHATFNYDFSVLRISNSKMERNG